MNKLAGEVLWTKRNLRCVMVIKMDSQQTHRLITLCAIFMHYLNANQRALSGRGPILEDLLKL